MSQRYGLLERSAFATLNAVYATQMSLPPRREWYPQFSATVREVTDLSPAFRRLSVHAPELADFRLMGPDEYIGLFMPAPGCVLHLPAPALNPRTTLAKMPEADRPDLRWYTVRRHLPARAQIDIDIVRGDHGGGHDGPGARWIATVTAGAPVGIRAGTAPYAGSPTAGRHLLLADETAVPALLAILESMVTPATGNDNDLPDSRAAADLASPHRPFRRSRVEVDAVVEVPGEDHVHPELALTDVELVFRGSAAPGTALLDALRTGPRRHYDYAWICAEAGAVAAVKRLVIKEFDVHRRQIMASGLWKVGRARL